MLETFYCKECGGEVLVTITPLASTFRITKGKVIRYDNKDSSYNDGVVFHCENDMEHDITPPEGTKLYKIFDEWGESVVHKILFENVYE